MDKEKIESITFICPTRQFTKTIEFEKVSFWGDYADCDLCGSHGRIEMQIECSCGKTHDVIVQEI